MLLLRLLMLMTKFIFAEQFSDFMMPQHSCLYNIYTNYFNTSTFIVYSKQTPTISYLDVLNKNFSKLIYSVEDNFDNVRGFGKFNNFIFVLDSTSEMNNLFETLTEFDLWNSRAKFLLIFNNNVNLEEVFKISWKHCVYNIAVVLNEIIYVYFPFKNGFCGEKIVPEAIALCKNATLSSIYPEKIPSNLQGCEVKLLALTLNPFVLNTSASNRESATQSGLEVTIIHLVAQRMNFTQIYVTNPYYDWGTRLENGTYTKMYGMLQREEVDIMFGFVYANRILDVAFDSTVSHLMDIADWWVPTASKIPEWMNLTKIFTISIWVLIGVMVLVHGVFWWVIGRKTEASRYYNNFILSIFNSWHVALQNIFKYPRSDSLRVTVYIWCISSMMIFTAYTSQLTSYLTNPLYERQIDSVEELLNSDLKHGFFPAVGKVFNPNYPLEKKILDDFVPCSIQLECEERTAFQRDMSFIANRRTLQYLIPRKWTLPNGRKMLYEIQEYEIRACLRYNTYKGFPLLDRMNTVIRGLQENGLISKWDKDLEFYVKKEVDDAEHKPLSMNHVQAPFYLLLLGLALSFVVLLLEIILCKFYKCNSSSIITE